MSKNNTYLVVGMSSELRRRVERFRLRYEMEHGNIEIPFTEALRRLLEVGLDEGEAMLKPLPTGFCGMAVNGEFVGVGEFL